MFPNFVICIPVYNSSKYLKDCIISILDQTFQDFKLILIDDGSTDDSGAICDSYATSDSRITVLHQSNQGQIQARNTAIRYVQKNLTYSDESITYVIFADSDDCLKQDSLEKINHAVMKNDFPDMIVYGSDKISKNGDTIEKYNGSRFFSGTLSNKRDILLTVTSPVKPNYNSLWGKATKVEFFDVSNYPSEILKVKYGEDTIQSYELFCKCNRITFLNESLYNYRINPTSITYTLDIQKGVMDLVIGSIYILNKIKQTGLLHPDELLTFINSETSDLLSMVSVKMIDPHVTRKNKIKTLKEITQNESFCKEILCKQTKHRSMSLLYEGKYTAAMNLIKLWSLKQFFKYALKKGFNLIKAKL